MEFTRRALVAAALLVALAALAFGVTKIMSIVWLVFVGVLIAVALRGLSDPIARKTGLRGRHALGLVVVVLLAATIGTGFAVAPTVSKQVADMRKTLPDSVEQVETWLAQTQWQSWLPQLAQQATGSEQQATNGPLPGGTPNGAAAGSGDGAQPQTGPGGGPDLQTVLGWLGSFVGSAASAVLGAFFVAFLGLWLAGEPKTYVNGLLKLLPTQHQPRAREVLDATNHQLRWWFVGQLVSMIAVALMIGIGCWILGVPMALLLGILAGLLEIIPNFGPILSAIPAVLIAFPAGKAVHVIVLYTAAQVIQNYLVRPIAQKKAVELPPALLLASQVVFGALFGFMGLLVAAPLVVVATVFVRKLYVEDTLHQDPDEPPAAPA